MEWAAFAGFFLRVTAAWKAVLSQTDARLGLATVVGKPGGAGLIMVVAGLVCQVQVPA